VVSPANIHDLRILEENISETKAPAAIPGKNLKLMILMS